LIFSTQWYFCRATASKPPCSPIAANDGVSAAIPSTLALGRISSSWSRTVRPLRSFTGTSERLKYPLACAFAARDCDSTAYVSTSVREKPSSVAIRSAPIPCGTNPVA